jgi:hypothetical protein
VRTRSPGALVERGGARETEGKEKRTLSLIMSAG